VQYNRDGDLIFSGSKDGVITVWSSENGERLGTYDTPGAAVNCISINRNSTRLLSAHANSSVELWEVETGKKLQSYPHDMSVRTVAFAEGDKSFLTVTDQMMGMSPFIHVYPIPEEKNFKEKVKPTFQAEVKNSGRILKAVWGYHNQTIVTATEVGAVKVYDTERAVEIRSIVAHEKTSF